MAGNQLFESILSRAKDKALKQMMSLTPKAQKELAKRLSAGVKNTAKGYAGNLDLNVLSNLARYGAHNGALPGAAIGGLGGAIFTPSTEEENLLGVKKRVAPTIFDRINGGILGAGAGALIGGGAGAYSMRELAKKIQKGEVTDDVAQAFMNRLGKGKVDENINNYISNYVKQHPDQLAKGGVGAANAANAVAGGFSSAAEFQGTLSALYNRVIQDQGIAKGLKAGDPNAAQALYNLSAMTGLPMEKIVGNPEAASLIQAAGAAKFQEIAANPVLAKRLRFVSDLAVGNKLSMNGGIASIYGSPANAGAAGNILGGLGALIGGSTPVGGPGALLGLSGGKWLGNKADDLYGTYLHGSQRRGLDSLFRDLSQTGNPESLMKGLDISSLSKKEQKEFMEAIKHMGSEVKGGKILHNPFSNSEVGPGMAPMNQQISSRLKALGAGAGIAGVGALGGGVMFGGSGGASNAAAPDRKPTNPSVVGGKASEAPRKPNSKPTIPQWDYWDNQLNKQGSVKPRVKISNGLNRYFQTLIK